MAKIEKKTNPEKKGFSPGDNALLITHSLQLISYYEAKKSEADGIVEKERWERALEQEKKNLERLNKIREEGFKKLPF